MFFGRFVALLRFLAAFLAGANKMAWSRFAVANALGAATWATIVGLAAYTFGKELHHVTGPFGLVVLAFVVAGIAWGLSYLRRHEEEMQAEAEKALPGSLV